MQPATFGAFISLMSYDDTVTWANSSYASKQSGSPAALLEAVREEWAALRDAAIGSRGGASAAAAAGGGLAAAAAAAAAKKAKAA